MARRKKRAAPAGKDFTPEQNKRKERGTERFRFQQMSVDREVQRMNSDLQAIGEKVDSENKHS